MKSQSILLILTVLFLKLLFVNCGNLPSEIQKCKSIDNDECIVKSINQISKLYPQGNSDFGLLNITAITLKDITFSAFNEKSPVQISFKYNNLIVTGVENIKVLRAHGFNKNLTETFELDFLIEKLSIDGDYEMKGQLLIFPFNGNGKGKIAFKDILLKYKMKIKLESRNNKNYGKIDKLKLFKIEPKKVILNLENVLNNNVAISKSINDIINENWQDLWIEFKSNIVKAVEEFITDILNRVLDELSVDDFYSD